MQIDDFNRSVQFFPDEQGNEWLHDFINVGFNGTRHGAYRTGQYAQLNFEGTGVHVFGATGNGIPTSNYSIDGQFIDSYTVPASLAGTRQFFVPFFSKTGLPLGKHFLDVVNANGTSPNILWLDYFVVDSSSTSSNPEQSIPTATGPTSTETLGETTTSVVTPPSPLGLSSTSTLSPTALTPSGSQDGQHRKNTGATVGGIIGALLLLTLVIIALLLFLRRRRARLARGRQPPDLLAAEDFDFSTGAGTSPYSQSGMYASSGTSDVIVIDSAGPYVYSPSFPTPVESSRTPTAVPNMSERSNMLVSESSGLLRPSPSPNTSTQPRSKRKKSNSVHKSEDASPISPPPATAPTPAIVLRSDVSQQPEYASPTMNTRGQILLRAFLGRTGADSSDAGHPPDRDVDSGLRIVTEPALPPPYSAD
ncbi:hypothetical protein C8Q74DRAFT_1373030 [Fomes fomentarius]|nr:hypothetical protein C8Q74DRAFT_1373030 [Fomes fomentarius]